MQISVPFVWLLISFISDSSFILGYFLISVFVEKWEVPEIACYIDILKAIISAKLTDSGYGTFLFESNSESMKARY